MTILNIHVTFKWFLRFFPMLAPTILRLVPLPPLPPFVIALSFSLVPAMCRCVPLCQQHIIYLNSPENIKQTLSFSILFLERIDKGSNQLSLQRQAAPTHRQTHKPMDGHIRSKLFVRLGMCIVPDLSTC